ncbi:hypothetical protein [Caballeronia udeis]|nr:hypothetical protein [Caballeronia udeis]
MEYASLQPELATLLRRLPLGTAADINECTVAFWDGQEVRGLRLRPDGGGQLDADFEFDERSFNQLHSDIVAWMAVPRYAMRPELVDWMEGRPIVVRFALSPQSIYTYELGL